MSITSSGRRRHGIAYQGNLGRNPLDQAYPTCDLAEPRTAKENSTPANSSRMKIQIFKREETFRRKEYPRLGDLRDVLPSAILRDQYRDLAWLLGSFFRRRSSRLVEWSPLICAVHLLSLAERQRQRRPRLIVLTRRGFAPSHGLLASWLLTLTSSLT